MASLQCLRTQLGEKCGLAVLYCCNDLISESGPKAVLLRDFLDFLERPCGARSPFHRFGGGFAEGDPASTGTPRRRGVSAEPVRVLMQRVAEWTHPCNGIVLNCLDRGAVPGQRLFYFLMLFVL